MVLLQAFTVGVMGFGMGTGMAAAFFEMTLRKIATRGIIQDAAACQRDALPHQNDSSRSYFPEGHLKESGGHARAHSETHHSNGECLQQHHAGQPPVGDAYGLQSAELLQVFQRKQIKSLTGYHGPDD